MAIRDFMTHRFARRVLGLCLTVLCASSQPARAQATFNPQDLQLSRTRLAFYASQDGSTPPASLFVSVDITNKGTIPLNWTVVPSHDWIAFDRRQGSVDAGATTSVAVAVDISHGSVGPQQGAVTVYDTDTAQSLGTITVFLRICQRTCVSVDLGATGHTISPLLFGSQSDWLNSGNLLWNRSQSPTCTSTTQLGGAPTAGIVDLLKPLGLRVLRYPGGVTGDFFNWSEAVGYVGQRVPQIDPYLSSVLGPTRQCPVFGPDEFTSIASQLQTQLLLVANVGTGTAQGAANWLTYNLQRGVHPGYWEIGNENYIQGFPLGDPTGFPYAFAAAYQYPDQYASRFTDYARALRAVDPSVKVGAVIDPDLSPWNDTMLARLTEPADFFATHLLFPKHACTLFAPDDQVYRTLLAAPILFTYQLEQLKQTIARNAVGSNKNANLAITEHGAYFWCLDFNRNRSLASALFAAMNFNVFFREPRIVMATHSNMSGPNFQAPVGVTIFGTVLRTAFYHVFRAYSQAAGGTARATSVVGAPTFSTDGLEGFPPLASVPALDTVAVAGPEEGTLRLFVVNRSLKDNVIAHVSFDSLVGSVSSISMAVVNGASYTSQNTMFDLNAVTTATYPVPTATEFDMLFPAHSLIVFAVKGVQ